MVILGGQPYFLSLLRPCCDGVCVCVCVCVWVLGFGLSERQIFLPPLLVHGLGLETWQQTEIIDRLHGFPLDHN